MQDIEQLSKDSSQALEQLSQPSIDDIEWLDMETFALAAKKTQQGISYLIHKGRLKEFKDEGVRVKKTDKWYLDAALVELVKSETPLKTVDQYEALGNQLRSTQHALIKYKDFEKRIDSLEGEKTALAQQIEALQAKTAEDLDRLSSEKEDLSKVVQDLVKEIEQLKKKPWWRVW